MIENILTSLLPFADQAHKVETLLFGTLEDDCHGSILLKVVVIVANFLMAGIVLAGTIGVIISGVQILTARDNATQVANGKRRLIDIVIGILAFGFMYVIANLLVPGGITLDSEILSTGETCPEVTPLPPPTGGQPTTPGQPTSPTEPGTSCANNPNVYQKDGFCFIKTKVTPHEYKETACEKYWSCQDKKPEWSSSCEAFARINANEMMHGFPSSKHQSATGGAYAHTYHSYPSPPDNSPLLCNGSIGKTSTGNSVNRNGFKDAVIVMVQEIMAGHPVTIAAGTRRLAGKTDATARHFITMVGVSDFVNATNVNNVEIQFQDGNCLSPKERYDQPIITLDGKQVFFYYIDPWNTKLEKTNTVGSRVWRFHYNDNTWYIFKYTP